MQKRINKWKAGERFDYACMCGEDFGGLENTVMLLEKFIKPGGKLIIGTRFSKIDDPPPELIEFEGETLPLSDINRLFKRRGYFITSMASDTDSEWERYIMWGARRHLNELRNNPDDRAKLL